MDPAPVIQLGPWQLLLLAVPLAGLFTVVVVLKLEQTRRLTIATVRAVVQLSAVGLVIGWVFQADRWYVIVGLLAVMLLVAGFTAASQISGVKWWRSGPVLSVMLGLLTGAMLLYISEAVVGVGGWSARYLIPIGGMLLGNAMTASVLSAERITADLKQRWSEVEAMVALGAGPWEASRPSFRKAVGAAMTPTVNAMMIVGVVKLPGMMTGQMLGGSAPFQAAMYQLLILIGIVTCDTFAAIATAWWSVRRRFAARPR